MYVSFLKLGFFSVTRKNLNNFVILQCTSAYPTECKDVNLKVLDEYGRRFKGKFQFAFVCNVHVVF